MKILFDKRIETMSVLQFISEYRNIVPYNLLCERETEYTKSIKKYLSGMEEHAAIRMIEDLAKKGFTFDAPYYFAYNINKKGGLSNKLLKGYLGTRIDSNKAFLLAKAIRDFSNSSNMNAFIDSNDQVYQSIYPY